MRFAPMPRLYFDLHECGTILTDDEGRDFPNLAIARLEAITAARGVMADEVMHGRLCLSCFIEIRDENGTTVGKVLFKDIVTVSGL